MICYTNLNLCVFGFFLAKACDCIFSFYQWFDHCNLAFVLPELIDCMFHYTFTHFNSTELSSCIIFINVVHNCVVINLLMINFQILEWYCWCKLRLSHGIFSVLLNSYFPEAGGRSRLEELGLPVPSWNWCPVAIPHYSFCVCTVFLHWALAFLGSCPPDSSWGWPW